MYFTSKQLALLPFITSAFAANCYMQLQMSSTTYSKRGGSLLLDRQTSTDVQGSLEQGDCQTNVNQDQPSGCNQLTTFTPVTGKTVDVDSSLPYVLEVTMESDNFKTGTMAYAGQTYSFGTSPCTYSSEESVVGAVAEQVCVFTC